MAKAIVQMPDGGGFREREIGAVHIRFDIRDGKQSVAVHTPFPNGFLEIAGVAFSSGVSFDIVPGPADDLVLVSHPGKDITVHSPIHMPLVVPVAFQTGDHLRIRTGGRPTGRSHRGTLYMNRTITGPETFAIR